MLIWAAACCLQAATIAKKNGTAIVAVCSDTESPLSRMVMITADAAWDHFSISQISPSSLFIAFLIADALVDELMRAETQAAS